MCETNAATEECYLIMGGKAADILIPRDNIIAVNRNMRERAERDANHRFDMVIYRERDEQNVRAAVRAGHLIVRFYRLFDAGDVWLVPFVARTIESVEIRRIIANKEF